MRNKAALTTSFFTICLAASAGLLATVITAISGGTFLVLWCTYMVAGCLITIVLSSVRAVWIDFFHVIKASMRGYDDQSSDDVHAPDPAPVVAVRPPSAKQNAELRILAVDDDPLVLDLVKIIAQNASIRHFTPASSAEAALAMLDDPNITFHYLLIDIRMLDMTGCAAASRRGGEWQVWAVNTTSTSSSHGDTVEFLKIVSKSPSRNQIFLIISICYQSPSGGFLRSRKPWKRRGSTQSDLEGVANRTREQDGQTHPLTLICESSGKARLRTIAALRGEVC